MRVLIAYASKRGGTQGIAEDLQAAMVERGVDADAMSVERATSVKDYDSVVVGSALYMYHWRRAAVRFVRRNSRALSSKPVWFFSSGPLDDSAIETEIPPIKKVQGLMDRIGARGHVTFGGRLTPDAKGFPASAMAKKTSGDWRGADQIRGFANSVVDALEGAVRPTS